MKNYGIQSCLQLLGNFAGARAKVRQSSQRCGQRGAAVRGDAETNPGLLSAARGSFISILLLSEQDRCSGTLIQTDGAAAHPGRVRKTHAQNV